MKYKTYHDELYTCADFYPAREIELFLLYLAVASVNWYNKCRINGIKRQDMKTEIQIL